MDTSIIKTVSLDSETVGIAKSMRNFSRWIRDQLRAHADGRDIIGEIALRIKWVKAAKMMAEMIAGQNNEYKSADEVVTDFLLLVDNQKSLGDFE
jgi:hypothetical protein